MRDLINRDWERAYLGCVLLDPTVLDDHPPRREWFSDDLNCQFFGAIEAARAERATPNMLEVSKRVPGYVREIATLTDIPGAANAAFYAKELAELARLRGIVRTMREATERVFDGATADEVFALLDKQTLALADDRASGYVHVADVLGDFTRELQEAYRHKGELTGVPTGFPGLDEKTNGWQRGTMSVIGARPGAGKTSIALNMASAALRKGHAVGIFSAEMSAVAIVQRIVADWASVRFAGIRNGILGQRDFDVILDAAGQIGATKLWVNDSPAIALRDLVSEARRMRRKERIDLVIIDYLSLVSNERRDVPRHEQVAEISKSLKSLARELDIPVIVLSQLTREAQGERPKLSHLRDSGAVEQDADMVMLLHTIGWEDDRKEMLKLNMIVEKNRNGATGDIPMSFTPNVMRFREVQEAWKS